MLVMMGKTLKNRAFLSVVFLDMFEKIVYEEMTEQYIDYMPKKIEKASEDYFSRHSLASYIKRGEEKDG